jgi:hypothetical protein
LTSLSGPRIKVAMGDDPATGNVEPRRRRREPVKPVVPCPWRPDELARVREEACRFIAAAKARHARSLGWEVGEYLFVRFYREDLGYIRWRGHTKELSLRDIAPLVGIDAQTLQGYLESAIMRTLLSRRGFRVHDVLHFYSGLYPLVDRLDAALALADWALAHSVPVRALRSLADALDAHVGEGGSVEDFIARKIPRKIRKPKRKAHTKAPRDDLVVERIARISRRWVVKASISPRLEARLREEVLALRRNVLAGAAGPEPPPPAPEPPEPPVPAPWTEDERRRLLGEAARFIRERVRRHRFEFAMQVGEHLFKNLFKGDIDLYGRAGPWKDESIQAIARDRRVDLPHRQLYACIHTYILVTQHGENAPGLEVPEFSIWKWDALYGAIERRPDALVDAVSWIADENVPRDLVYALAGLIERYLANGGRLEDLLPAAEAKPPDSPYRRVRRMLRVASRWVSSHPVPPATRTRTVAALDRLLETL